MAPRTLKICVVSDMHGQFPAIPPCDVLLLCGDNAPDFGFSDAGTFRQVIWYNTKFADWLHGVQEATDAQIFGIAGNHDFALFRHRISLSDDIPWTYLQDSGAVVEGLTIWGSPWCDNNDGWAFNLQTAQLANRFGRIPDKTDIVLLHMPPLGYGDQVSSFEKGHENTGSAYALKVIQRVQPQLVCFGHIHEGRGEWECGKTKLVNASVMNEHYRLVHQPMLLSLDAPLAGE